MAFDRAKKHKKVKGEPKKTTTVVESKPIKEPVEYGEPFPTVESLKKEKNGQGQKEFISYIAGEHINLRDAIKAKCYDCMGYYADGIMDCCNKRCPLHPFMPYNPNKPTLRQRKKDD